MSSSAEVPGYDLEDLRVVTSSRELRAMADPLRTTILDLLLERGLGVESGHGFANGAMACLYAFEHPLDALAARKSKGSMRDVMAEREQGHESKKSCLYRCSSKTPEGLKNDGDNDRLDSVENARDGGKLAKMHV